MNEPITAPIQCAGCKGTIAGDRVMAIGSFIITRPGKDRLYNAPVAYVHIDANCARLAITSMTLDCIMKHL